MALLNQQPSQQTAQGANANSQKMQEHVQNIVKVAHTFMYSNQTNDKFMAELKAHLGSGDKPKLAAAQTAASIMALLAHQSQYKMAQQAFIPAGIMIAGEILDLIASSQNHNPSERDAQETIILFINEVKKMTAKAGQAQPQQEQPQHPAMQGA